MGSEEKFNPRRAAAELASSIPDSRERKLTFHDQCAILATLYASPHMKRRVVAKAFGVTVMTVAHIAGCLERDPNPTRVEISFEKAKLGKNGEVLEEGKVVETVVPRDFNKNRGPNRIRHYPAVAAKFEALGPEEFLRCFYTEEIHQRLMVVKQGFDEEANIRSRRPMADERANQHEGWYEAWDYGHKTRVTFAVHFVAGEGWTWGYPERRSQNPTRFTASAGARTAALNDFAIAPEFIIKGPLPIPGGYKFFTPEDE